uniref:TSSK6 activating cochaperone n=1 Tax=Pseudonaja textilis TaxID=8673 RepID=A0A670ZD73_PSETE
MASPGLWRPSGSRKQANFRTSGTSGRLIPPPPPEPPCRPCPYLHQKWVPGDSRSVQLLVWQTRCKFNILFSRTTCTKPVRLKPQECFGLLECLHNNMQVQTQIAQEQLALLQDIRESMNLLISQQDQQNGELRGQLEQRPPRDPSPSPHPGS